MPKSDDGQSAYQIHVHYVGGEIKEWRADLLHSPYGGTVFHPTDHHAAGRTPQEAALNMVEYWWSLEPERSR